MSDGAGNDLPMFYKGLPVLSGGELEAIQFEEAFGGESAIAETGRRVLDVLEWGMILEIDLVHYAEEADPDATDKQKNEFVFGIEEGYEFALGVLSVAYRLRGIVVEAALGIGPNEIKHFEAIRSNQLPVDPSSDVGQTIEDATSSELLFEQTGAVLAEDRILDGLVQDHEERSRVQLSSSDADIGLEDIEYRAAGFVHGVASVLGFMVMMREKADFDAVLGVIDGGEPDSK